MKRKARHILRQDWSETRSHIEDVRKKLSLENNKFQPVNINQWQKVFQTIKAIFFTREDLGYQPYSYLKKEHFAITYSEYPDINKLNLIFDKDENAYFFIRETINEKSKYWIYEGDVKSIIKVISEMYVYEYYIVSKKYEWIFINTRYRFLIGCGTIITKMKAHEDIIKPESLDKNS